jgi:hypothetical protein
LRFGSRTFFEIPAFIISHPAPDAMPISSTTCGSMNTVCLRGSASVRVRSVVQRPTTPIGYVGIELRGRKIGVAEHLLNRTEVRAALQQVRRERVPEEMGVDALGVEPRLLRQLAEDEECPGARERPTACVQEELGPVSRVQVRPPSAEVAA